MKSYLLTGNCSHPGCKKRSVLAEKLPLAGSTWWERCADHADANIILSVDTLAKLGTEIDAKAVALLKALVTP